ncbi:helix-turn-helix domain-containing protein [Paenibacillus kyungheensis]
MELISNNLAELIRTLRQNKGISQRELAQDICSQSEISHIENGKVIPCVYTLISISKKLGINPNYFIDRITISKYELVDIVKKQAREYIHTKEYNKLNTLIKNYEFHSSFQLLEEKQFILWHKGITEYYISHHPKVAYQCFENAITLKNSAYKTEQDIHILNSYAIIKSEECDYYQALDIFNHALELYKKSDIISNFKLYVRLLYNISKTYTRLNEYIIADEFCDIGIESCKQEYSGFLYGELFYQKAYIKKNIQDYDSAEKLFNKSLFIFTEYDRSEYIKITLQQIEEIRQLKNKRVD